MAKTFTAPFAQTPKTGTAIVTGAITITANTQPNSVQLLQAGPDGCIVTSIKAFPRATVTARGLVIFLANTGGAEEYPISTALMAAHTVGSTTAIPATVFSDISEGSPLRLGANDILFAGSEVALAAGIIFQVQYTNF